MERQTRNVVIDRANDGDQEFTIQAWAKNGAGVLSINHGPLQGTEAFERLEANVRESARIVQDGGAERLAIQRSAELGIAYGPTTLRFPHLMTVVSSNLEPKSVNGALDLLGLSRPS